MPFLQIHLATPLPASRRVLAGGLALGLAILLSALALMWRELDTMRQRDHQRLDLLAAMAEAQASQLFDAGALALDNLASNLEQESYTVAQFEAMQTYYLQSLPFLRSIALVGLQGHVLATTSATDRGGRADLQRLSPHPLAEGRMTIGPWVRGRSLTEDARQPAAPAHLGFIPLLRPVRLGNGGAAVLVALVHPDTLATFQQQLRDIDAPDVRALLLLSDGSVLSAVGDAQPPGPRRLAHPRLQDFSTEHRGRYGPLAVEGEQTLGAWHRASEQPLVSVVEQPYAITTARWLRALRGPLLFMALAAVLIGLATRAAWRNARAREAAQHKLDEAQQETARREQELSVLFRSVQELIFRTDAQGVIRFANPRWRALTGHSPETAKGKRLADAMLPASRSAVAALFEPGPADALRTAQAELAGADGQTHVLEITAVPLNDSDGHLRGYAGSAVDITALHQAQQSLQEHLTFTERVLESNPLPMCLTDIRGRFITVNQAWEEFMGVPRAQALGRTNRELLPTSEAQAYDAHSEPLLREGGAVRYEERLHRPDGSVRDVQITKVLLRSAQGRPIGILVNKLDITDYLAARDQAQQASRSKSEFVANISHELRTPLQSILGFSELGAMRARQHEKFAAMFNDIHAAGLRMLGLVNDLLDISKIESTVGGFHFERNDVRDLIEDVAGELQVLLDRKHLALDLDLGRRPLISKVDPTRFSQVVRNVLSNAVKFAPQGSAIKICASACGEETIRIQIRDHGPGIPPSELESIFDAFVQSSKTRDGSGGTGLGLAICRKIVAAHGGSIHATNAPDGGSIFHITLPSASYTDTMPSPLL